MHYQINLVPQVDTLDGRLLASLVTLWLEDTQRKKTHLTYTSYCTQIARVLTWWGQHGDGVGWSLTRRTLDDLAAWLKEHYGWHAQNDALRRLRQCFHWAFENHYLPLDCSSWVPTPVGDKPEVRRRAKLEDLANLLAAAHSGAAGQRDVALIALLIGSGVRRAEAAGMDIEDVQLDGDYSGTVAVRHAKRVSGRTVQGRIVAVDAWTGNYLADWMEVRPLRGPLWVTLSRNRRDYTDNRLSLFQLTKVVKRAAAGAGLEEIIQGPHDLRRAFASWYAKKYRDNYLAGKLLSRQLGHSNSTMTEHYILDDDEDLREFIRSPLAGRTKPRVRK